jgi:hypothetical protein
MWSLLAAVQASKHQIKNNFSVYLLCACIFPGIAVNESDSKEIRSKHTKTFEDRLSGAKLRLKIKLRDNSIGKHKNKQNQYDFVIFGLLWAFSCKILRTRRIRPQNFEIKQLARIFIKSSTSRLKSQIYDAFSCNRSCSVRAPFVLRSCCLVFGSKRVFFYRKIEFWCASTLF